MRLILLATIIVFAATGLVFGQSAKKNDTLEQEIRKLDLAQADAIQRGDFAALNKLLAEDFTVTNPGNEILKGREATFTLIRNGTINYSSFVREPETFLFYGNTVVVMGLEAIKRTGTEQTVRRRYTNIWMKKKGKWLLTARHANVICPN
ncbi:MAG: nuclear transport factor 2 family protein [Acidobacteriota bacterium]|nr:nuclear transport factor 2 family protein [Acidobacteriota bacterium]